MSRWSWTRHHRTGSIALAAILVGTTACSSSSSGVSSAKSTLVIDTIAPFSGPDADFGPEFSSGCYPAVRLINKAGGVMGHTLKCTTTDTRGDPADAVPAVQKALATTSNLVGIGGPTSDEATATAPLINTAKIPFFAGTGQPIFDHNNYQYYHRITPADDVAGYAMAIWAHRKGYTRAAALFGNDIGSQGTVPTLTHAYKKEGGDLLINEKIALDQASYRPEILRVLAMHPQVIFTEVDPQTAATVFSELKQLNGLIPVIGADPTLQPTWFKAVSGAVGSRDLFKYFTAETPASASGGPAWQLYKTSLMASKGQVADPGRWATNGYTQSYYDSTNLMALAMIAAKSVKPSVYNGSIIKLTLPSPGAVKVYTFKQGKDALAAGKTIRYIGVTGPIAFNRWHNSPGQLEVAHYSLDGTIAKVPGAGPITSTEINAVSR